MVYTKHYLSPLGGILLAADEVGLMGLWFDGENIMLTICQKSIRKRKRQYFRKLHCGLMFTLPAKSRILCLRYTRSALPFVGRYGRSFCRFHTAQQLHTAIFQNGLQKRWDLKKCPRRQSEALSDIMRYRLSFHATESLERAEALRDMRAV